MNSHTNPTRSYLLALAVACGLALAASPAMALGTTDIDHIGIADLGLVESGGSLEYWHFMDAYDDPTIDIQSVDAAWLVVAVVDDWNCASWNDCRADWRYQEETAMIDLNDVNWREGKATAAIFWGNVTAEADLLNNNGMLKVTVSSTAGDFVVLWSKMITSYTYEIASGGVGGGAGDPSGAMPEPTAALVFVIGALVMRAGVRSRNS